MTDEPKNPIDEQGEAPQDAAVEPGLGQSEASQDPVAPAAETVASEPVVEEPVVEEPVETASAETAAETDIAAEEPAEEPEPVELPEPKPEAPVELVEEAPAEETDNAKGDKSEEMDWYILKVQSNREDSIREGLLRRVAIAGLEYFFGDVIVPTEKVTEFKSGKKRVVKRKLYPGYLVVHMEINDDTWFLVRETPGIGDFTGAAGHPSPMQPHEVARIVSKQEEKSDEAPKLKIGFAVGDRVKINEGTFENFEGEVEAIDQASGRVTIMINIFGRSTPVELEYWQIEAL